MPNSIHSALYVPWEAIIENLQTRVRVGIHPHETEPQMLLVSATIRGHYAAYPKHINECMNYEILQQLTQEIWPVRAQTALVETLVMECFAEIFDKMKLAEEATVSITKPEIFEHTEKVGMRLTLKRADFLQIRHAQP